MNLRKISQLQAEFPPSTPAATVLTHSLQFNFLEKAQKVVSTRVLEALKPLHDLAPVSPVLCGADDKMMLQEPWAAGVKTHVVDLQSGEVTSSEVTLVEPVVAFYQLSASLFAFHPTKLLILINSSIVMPVSFDSEIIDVLDAAADEKLVQFLLLQSSNTIVRIKIDLSEHTDEKDTFETPHEVRTARFFGDAVVVMTYSDELIVFHADKTLQVLPALSRSLRAESVDDFQVDADAKAMFFLVDHSRLVATDDHLTERGATKFEGLFTSLARAPGHMVVSEAGGFPVKVLVKTDGTARRGSEVLITRQHIAAVSAANSAFLFDAASSKLVGVTWTNRSVCTTKPFLHLSNPRRLSAVRDANLANFQVLRGDEDEHIFKIYAQFRSNQAAILVSDRLGNCYPALFFNLASLTGADSQARCLGNLVIAGEDHLVFAGQDQEANFLKLFSYRSMSIKWSFKCTSAVEQVATMPKHGLLFVRLKSGVGIMANRGEGWEQLKILEFQDDLVSIEVRGDVLMAVGRKSSVHFYRLAVKAEGVDVTYLAGDSKGRKALGGSWFSDDRAFVVLENGQTLFVSRDKETSFKRSGNDYLSEVESPSPLSPEILFPFAKVATEGTGALFSQATPEQIELLSEGRPFLQFADRPATGLLFDSQGNVELVSRTSPVFFERVREGSAGAMDQRAIFKTVFAAQDKLSNFRGESVIDLDQRLVSSEGKGLGDAEVEAWAKAAGLDAGVLRAFNRMMG